MRINPVTLAAQAKGSYALLKRVYSITNRYGLTPAKMDRSLRLFVQTLSQFGCGASLALTAVVLKRNPVTIVEYLGKDVEFAVHGYTHVDYARLSLAEQLDHLRRARELFAAAGVKTLGFRSPYLRRDAQLYTAIEEAGFSYVSNQPIMWDVLDFGAFAPSAHAAYERAVSFYAPWLANERPSLPRFDGRLVEIPVSLPDDEMLVDRLGSRTGGAINEVIESAWCSILSETYRRGELFTVQLHPERIAWGADGLSAVLSRARALRPPVWVARLSEIAAWWRARAAATVNVQEKDGDAWHISVTGPPGTVILARQVKVLESTRPWADGYRRVEGTSCTVRAERRPFVGASPTCPPALLDFVRRQGYIVQVGGDRRRYSIYLDQPQFSPQDELPLLAQIEDGDGALVRLGRWPDGARSALSITGDIDALTIGDYGLRLFGK